MAIVERKFTFAGTRVELLLLLENESDQRYADFMQQRHGVRASDVWLLSPQWRGRGRLVKTLDSLCFDQLSSWRAVDVPEDVLALQREGKTVELTFGGPPRGPVTVTAVCHHESFMPWFRVVLRLLGQEEEESNEISASAPLPAPAAPMPPRYRTPGRKPDSWNQAAIDRLLRGDAVDDVRAEWRVAYTQGTNIAPATTPDGEEKTWQKRVWRPYLNVAGGPK
jgi:hypothetical protein